jgi:hypothetical protein
VLSSLTRITAQRRSGQCVKILFSQVWPKDKRITV